MDNSTENTEVINLKTRGNEAYSNGNYLEAINYFTEAIKLDNKNETLYCNRSMSYSSLNNWENAIMDAKMVYFLSIL